MTSIVSLMKRSQTDEINVLSINIHQQMVSVLLLHFSFRHETSGVGRRAWKTTPENVFYTDGPPNPVIGDPYFSVVTSG